MIDTIATWLSNNLEVSSDLLGKIIGTAVIIIFLFLLRPLVTAIVSRRTDDISTLYRWRKVSEYTALILGLYLISRVWFTGSQSIATYLGLLSAGLAIALQDPIANFVGWLFIVSRRPLEVGDRIEIGGHAGDVIDIRFFQFSLMEIRAWVQADQSTGRILHIPNRKIFSDAIANFSRGFAYIWHEVPVEITFESDWRKAKKILAEIAERHSIHHAEVARKQIRAAAKRYMISYDNLTPIVYTKVNPSGVLLTLRYLSDPRQRRVTEEKIWEDILAAFEDEPKIEFAYPTQRIYYHPAEGRPSREPEELPTNPEEGE
jgi:small-conductance mechanosensitive channel